MKPTLCLLMITLISSISQGEIIRTYDFQDTTKTNKNYEFNNIEMLNKTFIASELNYLENQFTKKKSNETLSNSCRKYVFTISGSIQSINIKHLHALYPLLQTNRTNIFKNTSASLNLLDLKTYTGK